MNTGKHKIWIKLTKKNILIKFSEKNIDNVFAIFRGRGKRNRVLVGKRSAIRRALVKKNLKLIAYLSSFDFVFWEFMISIELYRKLKDEADQVVYNFEIEQKYDEESMVF